MSEKKRKIAASIVIALAVLSVVLWGIYLGAGAFFYGLALDPDNKMLFTNTTVAGGATNNDEPFEDRSEWFESVPKNGVSVCFESDLYLRAQVLNQNSDKWVILIHGYRGKGDDMAAFAYRYYEKGYSVLIPDLRGHGESEGDVIGMGWLDKSDIIWWINWIIAENNNARIALHGVSMGGATVMMTTGEKLPENVFAAVEDCGYTSVYDQFTYVLTEIIGLPEYPLMSASDVFVKTRAGYSMKEASSVEQLKKSETPTLFIHGDADDFVPYFMLDECYEAAACEKQKLVVAGAKHGRASSVAPDLYWETVFSFLNARL